jgi:hypothetical protein
MSASGQAKLRIQLYLYINYLLQIYIYMYFIILWLMDSLLGNDLVNMVPRKRTRNNRASIARNGSVNKTDQQ